MDKEAKKQYMETLRKDYLKADKKGKTAILNEYCRRTGEDRKHAIKKFRYKVKIKEEHERKKRSCEYGKDVVAVLVKAWEIFDRSCGQRLKPSLETEVDRLRKCGEIQCSDEVAGKLKRISPSTIDRKLRHEKEFLKFNLRHGKKKHSSLLSEVPVKTSMEMNRQIPGEIQIDCVEHCGSSAAGDYVNSLAATDICFGWWEAEALMGKGQERAFAGIKNCRARFPFRWGEMHPDNGDNILNWQIYRYARKENIRLSRSRAYHKNDNCLVEQKNSTHVRKPLGYLRFDTEEELEIINDLFRNELRLFKNFFQPVMKLVDKTKVKGRSHRKYDKPKTPYHRIMESEQVDARTKEELKKIYDSLNPAELKRGIDEKVKKLYEVYKRKKGSQQVDASPNLTPSTVSYYLIHQL
jgi:hypothetical protein